MKTFSKIFLIFFLWEKSFVLDGVHNASRIIAFLEKLNVDSPSWLTVLTIRMNRPYSELLQKSFGKASLHQQVK